MERLASRRNRDAPGGGVEPGRRLHGRGGRSRVVGSGRRGRPARALRRGLAAESGAHRRDLRPRRGAARRADTRAIDRHAAPGGAGHGRPAASHVSGGALEVPRPDEDDRRRHRLSVRRGSPLEREGPRDRSSDRAPARMAGRGARGEARHRGPRFRRSAGVPRDAGDRGVPAPCCRSGRRAGDRAALEPGAVAAPRPDGGGGDARAGGLLGGRGAAPGGRLARSGPRPEARGRAGPDRREPRAPRLRARGAAGPRHRRAGPAAVGRAPAVPPPERPLARDERTLSPAEVVGRCHRAGGVPRPLVPQRRRVVRPLGAAAARVDRRDRPAGRSPRAAGRRANADEIRAVV